MDTPIISEDLTNVIPACDPALEDCGIAEESALAAQGFPARDLYIFAGVSLINAIAPAIYYVISEDYSGDYGNREHPRDRVELEVMLP